MTVPVALLVWTPCKASSRLDDAKTFVNNAGYGQTVSSRPRPLIPGPFLEINMRTIQDRDLGSLPLANAR